MIQQALVKAKFNKSQAAKSLGITRAQLYVKLRQYHSQLIGVLG